MLDIDPSKERWKVSVTFPPRLVIFIELIRVIARVFFAELSHARSPHVTGGSTSASAADDILLPIPQGVIVAHLIHYPRCARSGEGRNLDSRVQKSASRK